MFCARLDQRYRDRRLRQTRDEIPGNLIHLVERGAIAILTAGRELVHPARIAPDRPGDFDAIRQYVVARQLGSGLKRHTVRALVAESTPIDTYSAATNTKLPIRIFPFALVGEYSSGAPTPKEVAATAGETRAQAEVDSGRPTVVYVRVLVDIVNQAPASPGPD